MKIFLSRLKIYSVTIFDRIKKLIAKIYFWRVIVVLIIPPIITIFLFNPLKVMELPQNFHHIVLTPMKDASYFNRTIVADIIQTSLNLGLRNLCVKNEGFLQVNGKTVSKEQSESSKSSVGIAKIEVESINGTTSLLIKPTEEKCVLIQSGEKETNINLGSLGGTIAEPGFEEKNFIPNPDLNEPLYKIGINFDKVKFFLKNNVLSENLAKLLIIFMFWNSFIILLNELYKFIRK